MGRDEHVGGFNEGVDWLVSLRPENILWDKTCKTFYGEVWVFGSKISQMTQMTTWRSDRLEVCEEEDACAPRTFALVTKLQEIPKWRRKVQEKKHLSSWEDWECLMRRCPMQGYSDSKGDDRCDVIFIVFLPIIRNLWSVHSLNDLFYVWPDAVGWKNDGSTSFPNIAL